MMKRIVIVGATSGIAKECARIWVKESPVELTLVVRDTSRAQALVSDLLVRSPNSKIDAISTDFTSPAAIKGLVDAVYQSKTIDIVLIAHGTLPEQAECENNLELCNDTLEINGVSPCLFAEAFANVMQHQGKGSIAIIGSVAGDRGRKSNYIYGAAKGLVSRYAEGMQHRFASSRLNITLIKPGPTATPMTEKMRANGMKMAPADLVAKEIVEGIAKGKAVIYTPKKWQIIMLIIRHLPSFVFNKLNI
jgi:decaprenylphospho-beta-D-erythro-pentofuranosid-2-ulose 2-reductase